MLSQRSFKYDNATSVNPVRRHRPEFKILLYMILLMLFGLIVIYAIGPQRANVMNNAYDTDFYGPMYFFAKQTASLLIALGVFILTASIPYSLLLKNIKKILIVGFSLSLLLMFLGNFFHVEAIAQCSLGACRWFNLGFLGSFQPAELLKFGILLYAAVFLGSQVQKGQVNDLHKTYLPLLKLVGAALILIVIVQKDMGTGMTLLAMILSMLVVAGMNFRIATALSVLIILSSIIFILIAPHRLDRITTFLSGDSTTVDDPGSYHIAHAKIAIGSGGIAGVGIGNSVQATGYLPEAINDSVFAIMGETFGFVGLFVILTIFSALLLELLNISDRLQDNSLRILVAGIFGWLASHIVLNVGAMIGIVPLTGITLPLLSFGGTSMVFISAILGLAFQLSRFTVTKNRFYESEDRSYSSLRRRKRTELSSI